jgi:hypothetical protein
LACLSAAVALILSLLESLLAKASLFIVSGALLAIIVLSIYPIMHFARSLPARILLVEAIILLECLFGWMLWPSIRANIYEPPEANYGELVVGKGASAEDMVANPESDMTCHSYTIESTVSTYDHRVKAYFVYSTNYNQTALGEGIPTLVQTIAPGSYIEQTISGLSENTTYYYKLIVKGQEKDTVVNSFTTPACRE